MIIDTNKFEIRKFDGYFVTFQHPVEPAVEVNNFGYVELANTDIESEIYFKNVVSGYRVRCIFMNENGVLTREPVEKDIIEESYQRLKWVLEGEKWVFNKNGFLLRTHKLFAHTPMQQRISSAALRLPDGTIVVSPRHYDRLCHEILDKLNWSGEGRPEEGFVDQFGKFLDRKEAFKVAYVAGQIIRRCGGDYAGILYSENII